jgi:uncharacterized protein (TIGR03083 family)
MRHHDPDRVSPALLAQAGVAVGWLEQLGPESWAASSVLPAWTVAELAAHVTLGMQAAAETVRHATTERPLPIDEYIAAYGPARDQIRDWPVDAAAGGTPGELLAQARTARAELAAALSDTVSLPPVVEGTRGPLRAGDYLATRVLELVVHADDLGRSVPAVPEPRHHPAATRITTQLLADLLVARAPGRSVELRVPPYAAVQCVEGPRHTRGTPPNVVETDPLTWIRLATGRMTWSDAVATGRTIASGERSDLGPYLPLL